MRSGRLMRMVGVSAGLLVVAGSVWAQPTTYRAYSAVGTVEKVTSGSRAMDVQVTLRDLTWKSRPPMAPYRITAQMYSGPKAFAPSQPKAGTSVQPRFLRWGDRVLATLWRASPSGNWYIGACQKVTADWDFDTIIIPSGGGNPAPSALRVGLSVSPNPVTLASRARVDITVRNTTSGTVKYQTSSGQQFEVSATKDGRVVWTWSHGKFFTMAIQTVTLKAGETKRFSAEWDLKADSGTKVTPGRYRITAHLTIAGRVRPAAVPVDLVVKQ